jgi:hypothetical protein
MKKFLVAGALVLVSTTAAQAEVDVNIGLFDPRPVYVQPRPVYYHDYSRGREYDWAYWHGYSDDRRDNRGHDRHEWKKDKHNGKHDNGRRGHD